MTEKTTDVSVSGALALLTVLGNATVLRSGYLIHHKWYWVLLVTVPLMIFSLIDFHRRRL